MTMSPIGVAILSAVRHASSYIPLLAATQGVVVLAIGEAADAPEWAHADARLLGERHDIPVTNDIDSMLARDDIQLVVVCSEPTRHVRLAMIALDAGKHVVVDKPFATTLADATALVRSAQAAPGHLTMMHRLFSPQIVRARAAIDAGHIGLPLSIDLEWLASDGLRGEAVERPELVTDPALSGGGELMNFLTYPITTLRHLTGSEITSVYAEAGSLFFDHHTRAGVEDLGILSLALEHGIVATITVGRVPQAPSHLAVHSTLRVIGSHGHLTIDESQPVLETWRQRERRGNRIGGDAGQQAIQGMLSACVDDLRHGRPPLVTAGDGWASVAAIDAAYRSIQACQPVDVPSLSEVGPGQRSHMIGETHDLTR